jgi:pimeloyl-ACP methyl ester carboxylesterase/DNA-binding XRE family transcriptional regulator
VLKRHRLAVGLTQEALAERAGLSARAISDLERGVNAGPRLETLRLLAEALGLGADARAAFAAAAGARPLAAPPAAPGTAPHAASVAGGGRRAVAPGSEERGGPRFDVRYAARTDGARTAYGVVGHGPVLLVPPGFVSHLEWWGTAPGVGAFLGPLAAHRTVVLYDRHGCGLSDRDRTDFTAGDDLRDLDAVAAAVGPLELELFGISWGALPAIAYAARHPGRVRRLVLYGAAGRDELALPGARERLAALSALRRADLELSARAEVVRFFPSGTDEATFRSFVQLQRMAAPPAMQERLATVRFGVGALLAAVRAPTLVLHRRGDLVCAFATGQHYARTIPGARLVPLDGDAHFPWAGDCPAVVTPILDFLRDGDARDGDA